ncbi:hypothetical protein ACVIWV_007692 [Bradyrhizobium diazoefficiens]
MMLRSLLIGFCLAVSLPFFAARADSGQIIAKHNLADLCKSAPASYRKTILYVDLASIKKGENEWGLTILNKLELGPRETLTVLGVNPGTFEISELFESCYPTLSKAEMDAERSGRSLWENLTQLDPEGQQRENIQAFDARLRSALNNLIEAATKLSSGKRRNILAAISVDKNRFSDSHVFYRVIVYTDGVIADPALGEITNDGAMQAIIEKYPASFGGADVYVYGIVGDDAERSLEMRTKIFGAFFLNNWGFLRSFAPSLPQQRNATFQPARVLNGTFEGGGTKGTAKLMITPMVAGTELAQCWVTFVAGSKYLFVPFQSEYICNGSECKLVGEGLEKVPFWATNPYFRKGDRLTLASTRNGGLDGLVQSASQELFEPTKTPDAQSVPPKLKNPDVQSVPPKLDAQYILKFRSE